MAFSLRRFDTRPSLVEKLRCAENVLAFLGSLSIAMAGHSGLSLEPRTDLGDLDLIRCWDRGIGMGHWKNVIHKTTAALMGRGAVQSPVEAFPYFYWKRSRGKHIGEAAHSIRELTEIRNDCHHGRPPMSAGERADVVGRLRSSILTIMRAARFLKDYPLWYVEHVARNRGERLLRVRYRWCMGDNPEFEIRQGQCEKLPYEKSLYFVTGDVMVDLTPWMVLRTCPKCGADAVFYLERINRRKRQLTYKSFNRGHQEETDEHWELVSQELGL